MAKNYIDNVRFEELIFSAVSSGVFSDELVSNLELLIDTIIGSFGFHVDKEDAKQDCFLIILKVLQNFDTSKGSAFNYLTTVCLNGCKAAYTKNKKYYSKIDLLLDKYKDNRDFTLPQEDD